jgi:hypothetical protein
LCSPRSGTSDRAVRQHGAVAVDRSAHGGSGDLARGLVDEPVRHGVVEVQHDDVVRVLELEDPPLQVDVFVPRVAVQVVRRDIRDACHPRRGVDAFQLRVRHLGDDPRRGSDPGEQREQPHADVAAHDVVDACRVEHRADQRRRGRLAR